MRTSLQLRCLARIVTQFAIASCITSTAVRAQSTPADSLADRLERAEEAIAVLRQQIAGQAEAAVQTKTGVRMELSGRVLMNVFSNTRKTNNFDVPYFVQPRQLLFSGNVEGAQNAGGMSMRQTSLAGAISVPSVLRGSFTGDVEVDFFGGQMPSGGGRTFPLIRLRTARGILTWSHAELLVGQETILISPHNPVSVASFGFPGFTAAGNLWLWLPQVRATVETGTGLRAALQAAVLAPTAGNPVGNFDTEADSAELTRTPFGQARARLRWGQDESRGEIGVGIHRGRLVTSEIVALDPPRQKRHSSQATSLDLLVPLTRWVDIRGEAYKGQALRGLGTGGIGQSFGVAVPGRRVALKTRAAWVQLNVKPTSGMTLGSGYGVDDPEDDNIPTGRSKNVTVEGHLVWQFAGHLLMGAELRQTTTTHRQPDRRETNNHVNLGFGFVF